MLFGFISKASSTELIKIIGLDTFGIQADFFHNSTLFKSDSSFYLLAQSHQLKNKVPIILKFDKSFKCSKIISLPNFKITEDDGVAYQCKPIDDFDEVSICVSNNDSFIYYWSEGYIWVISQIDSYSSKIKLMEYKYSPTKIFYSNHKLFITDASVNTVHKSFFLEKYDLLTPYRVSNKKRISLPMDGRVFANYLPYKPLEVSNSGIFVINPLKNKILVYNLELNLKDSIGSKDNIWQNTIQNPEPNFEGFYAGNKIQNSYLDKYRPFFDSIPLGKGIEFTDNNILRVRWQLHDKKNPNYCFGSLVDSYFFSPLNQKMKNISFSKCLPIANILSPESVYTSHNFYLDYFFRYGILFKNYEISLNIFNQPSPIGLTPRQFYGEKDKKKKAYIYIYSN